MQNVPEKYRCATSRHLRHLSQYSVESYHTGVRFSEMSRSVWGHLAKAAHRWRFHMHNRASNGSPIYGFPCKQWYGKWPQTIETRQNSYCVYQDVYPLIEPLSHSNLPNPINPWRTCAPNILSYRVKRAKEQELRDSMYRYLERAGRHHKERWRAQDRLRRVTLTERLPTGLTT